MIVFFVAITGCPSNTGDSASVSSFDPPAVNQMAIGWAGYFGSSRLNGTIKKLAFYPKRLSNAELQGITL
jgi:hypothetical protein